MVRGLLLSLSLFSMVALVGTGCVTHSDRGCTSDDECRGERVCSPSGACEDPERTPIGEDAGVDVDADASEDTDVEPLELQTARVYDACQGDLRVTRISLSAGTDISCEDQQAPRIDINIEGALDLNEQSPGGTDVPVEGIEVLGCEGMSCTRATGGELTLAFYEPGEIVDGSYGFTFEPSDAVTDQIAGQTFEGEFRELQLNWCAFAGPECRR